MKAFVSPEELAALLYSDDDDGTDDAVGARTHNVAPATPMRARVSPPASPLKSPAAVRNPGSSVQRRAQTVAPAHGGQRSGEVTRYSPPPAIKVTTASSLLARGPERNERQASSITRPHTSCGHPYLSSVIKNSYGSPDRNAASTAVHSTRTLSDAPSREHFSKAIHSDRTRRLSVRAAAGECGKPGMPVRSSWSGDSLHSHIVVRQGGFGDVPVLVPRPATSGGCSAVRNLEVESQYAADPLDVASYERRRPGQQEMWRVQGKTAAWAEKHRQDRLRRRDEDIQTWQQQRIGDVASTFEFAEIQDRARKLRLADLHQEWVEHVFEPIQKSVDAQVDAVSSRELSRRLRQQGDAFVRATNDRGGHVFVDCMDLDERQAMEAARKAAIRYRSPQSHADPTHRSTERLSKERQLVSEFDRVTGRSNSNFGATRGSFAPEALGRPANRLIPQQYSHQNPMRQGVARTSKGSAAQRSSPGVVQNHFSRRPPGTLVMRQEHLAATPGHSKGKAFVGSDAAQQQAKRGAHIAGNFKRVPRTVI
eukprot:SAG31_NODE_426_length_15814_cov_25.737066_1_plen_537_part_00